MFGNAGDSHGPGSASYIQSMAADRAKPKTRKMTADERVAFQAARDAIAKGQSIKPVAFRAARSKAEKASYLRAHL
jgi:hypothetical protein